MTAELALLLNASGLRCSTCSWRGPLARQRPLPGVVCCGISVGIQDQVRGSSAANLSISPIGCTGAHPNSKRCSSAALR
jgi:hypothetical protein